MLGRPKANPIPGLNYREGKSFETSLNDNQSDRYFQKDYFQSPQLAKLGETAKTAEDLLKLPLGESNSQSQEKKVKRAKRKLRPQARRKNGFEPNSELSRNPELNIEISLETLATSIGQVIQSATKLDEAVKKPDQKNRKNDQSATDPEAESSTERQTAKCPEPGLGGYQANKLSNAGLEVGQTREPIATSRADSDQKTAPETTGSLNEIFFMPTTICKPDSRNQDPAAKTKKRSFASLVGKVVLATAVIAGLSPSHLDGVEQEALAKSTNTFALDKNEDSEALGDHQLVIDQRDNLAEASLNNNSEIRLAGFIGKQLSLTPESTTANQENKDDLETNLFEAPKEDVVKNNQLAELSWLNDFNFNQRKDYSLNYSSEEVLGNSPVEKKEAELSIDVYQLPVSNRPDLTGQPVTYGSLVFSEINQTSRSNNFETTNRLVEPAISTVGENGRPGSRADYLAAYRQGADYCLLVENYSNWDQRIAYATCRGESEGWPWAYNKNDYHPSKKCYGSWGLMQIGCLHFDWMNVKDSDKLFDPQYNIEKANQLYRICDCFDHWSAYKKRSAGYRRGLVRYDQIKDQLS